jgi:predicted nucleic acid-binding protein
MAWLVDTNVLSDARKPRPDSRVADFFRTHRSSELYVSTITFAEIRFGIEVLEDPTRRAILTDWLTTKLRPMFDGRVLPLNEDIFAQMALINGAGSKDWAYLLPD